MKLTFYGAARAVTGSCHCIDACGKRILVDCGLQQGRDEIDDNKLPFAPGEVDYVLDHTDSRHYAVFFKNISSEESERYVSQLKKNGYSEMNSAENTVSVGTVLEGEKAYLSVSYSDGVLGVLIALRE